MTNDNDMNKEFEDNGAVYPKVSPEHIEGLLAQVKYDVQLVADTTTTIVTGYITMGNVDFTLATATMACVDKRNFNKELGAKYCTEKCKVMCKDKLWELEGYALAKRVSKPKIVSAGVGSLIQVVFEHGLDDPYFTISNLSFDSAKEEYTQVAFLKACANFFDERAEKLEAELNGNLNDVAQGD